jgi:hypothetical protein
LKKGFCIAVLGLVALLLPFGAFAKSKSTEVHIYQTTQVGSATLKPGVYHVTVDTTGSTSNVVFLQNGKQVATIAGQPVSLKKAASNTSVTLDNSGSVPRITEIDFEGQPTAVGFTATSSASAGD